MEDKQNQNYKRGYTSGIQDFRHGNRNDFLWAIPNWAAEGSVGWDMGQGYRAGWAFMEKGGDCNG